MIDSRYGKTLTGYEAMRHEETPRTAIRIGTSLPLIDVLSSTIGGVLLSYERYPAVPIIT